MMMDVLKMENIQIVEKADNWQDAIRISVRPLAEHGYVEKRYSESIIENVKNLGAYFIVAPEVAMPHARPEQGVIETQIGITLFKEPVLFEGKEDETKLFVVLAASDSEKHIDAMVMIAEVLSDEDKIHALCEAESREIIYQLFTS